MAQVICPECNGDGWVIGVVNAHGCDGTDEDCARTCPVPEQVQEGCDFCGGDGYVKYE